MVFGQVGETLELVMVASGTVIGILLLIWIQRTTAR